MYDELTPSDIRKMEDEIEYRKLVVRPKALEDVKEARAHGDLSVRILNIMQRKIQESEREPDPLSGENDQDRKGDLRELRRG